MDTNFQTPEKTCMRRTNMQIIEWDLDKTSEGAVFEENVKMHKATVVIEWGALCAQFLLDRCSIVGRLE